MMQTRKNIIVNTCTVCILDNAKFQWEIYNVLPWKCVQTLRIVHEIR